MPRLLFEKTGNAVWISHLDLMRLFQRSFKRAGLSLTHTNGFNPRPSVSIALPLSVGVESVCELLDFALDGEDVPGEELRERLNACLTEGVQVLDVYDHGKKTGEISLLRCEVILEYDRGVPAGCVEELKKLFQRDSLPVPKKTKNGIQDQDILSMIRRLGISQMDDNRILLDGLICCQNPTLNPMQLTAAIARYLPEYAPDFSRCKRLEIYDRDENVFR